MQWPRKIILLLKIMLQKVFEGDSERHKSSILVMHLVVVTAQLSSCTLSDGAVISVHLHSSVCT